MQAKTVFFRNDDAGLFTVGEEVSAELVNVTRVFIEENIPISHGVVPSTINSRTVEWLKGIKERYPRLIGIDQHGYCHKDYDGRGEFSDQRSYFQQKADIERGFHLMKELFGVDFSYCFIPPGNRYNRNTKVICEELGFRVLSSAISPKLEARLLFLLGRLLNKNVLLGKHVAYHRKNRYDQRGFSLIELSVGVGFVEDYRRRKVKSPSALLKRYFECEKYYDVIGVNLHHWVFDIPENVDIVADFIRELKAMPHISFRLMEDIANEFIVSQNA